MSTPLKSTFNEQEWQEWHHKRVADNHQDDSPPALTGTFWVHATELSWAQTFPGVPGQWYTVGHSIVGVGLTQPYSTTGSLQIRPGEKLKAGELIFAALERDGQIALRTFDHTSENLTTFSTIASFSPAPTWRLAARFEADPIIVDIRSADGYIKPTQAAGWIHFDVDGNPYRLLATDNGDALRVVFSDRSSEVGVHHFRFLDVAYPNDAGETTIDFNRAFLPPLAFSPHFLCPSPVSDNQLSITIEAGEKWPVFN